MNIVFEALVLDMIGQLPEDRAAKIQELNLQGAFGTQASEWRDVLRETLHLSDTIHIAAQDLWYRNRAELTERGYDYPPEQFAREFTDHYFADDSTVDVWPDGALEQAKWRVARYQSTRPRV